MANQERGHASFEHQGKRYTLVLNPMAWAEAQDVLATRGRKALTRMQILQRVASGFERDGYALFFGMLQEYHPEISTLSKASELMEAVGQPAVDAVQKAMGLANPDPRDTAALAEGARPPTAQAKKAKRTKSESSTSALARTA